MQAACTLVKITKISSTNIIEGVKEKWEEIHGGGKEVKRSKGEIRRWEKKLAITVAN